MFSSLRKLGEATELRSCAEALRELLKEHEQHPMTVDQMAGRVNAIRERLEQDAEGKEAGY